MLTTSHGRSQPHRNRSASLAYGAVTELSAAPAPTNTSADATAGAARAESRLPTSVIIRLPNECNGEEVAVEGSIHFENHSTITANGTHVQFTINLIGGKGVAVLPPTSAHYVESDTTRGRAT